MLLLYLSHCFSLGTTEWIVLSNVTQGSLGANVGLVKNDRIVSIDGRRCKTLEDVHLSLLNKSRCVITVKRTVIVEVTRSVVDNGVKKKRKKCMMVNRKHSKKILAYFGRYYFSF